MNTPSGSSPDAGTPTDTPARAVASKPGAAPNHSLPGRLPGERSPLREMLAIAIPTVATTTSYTLMTFTDKLMSSRIGADAIYVGAQGNGGLSSWVLISLVFGALSVVNTFVSQNLGAGKAERGAAYAWNGLWLCALAFVFLMIPWGLSVPHVFDLLRGPPPSPDALAALAPDAAAQAATDYAAAARRDAMASEYARILIFGSIVTLASRALGQYFYGMHRPMVVLAAAVTANLTNLVVNSFLIYGPVQPREWGLPAVDAWFAFTARTAQALGIPRMEIAGAAWGTLLATGVELAILAWVFLGPRSNAKYATRAAWRPSATHIKDLFRVGWPAGLMFGNEMICWAAFMVYFVGHFGAQHSTAGWIAHQWMSLSFMPAVGISTAVTAMVGKAMGAGRPDVAAARAWLGLRLAMLWMGFCGVCFVVFGEELTRAFIDPGTPPEETQALLSLGTKFLILTAVFQLFDAIAMTLSGALRGAGDTVVVGVVTVVASWGIIVGGGLAAITYMPQWESLGPWGAASLYIILLSLFILGRFISGRWKTINLVKNDAPAPGVRESLPTPQPGPVDGVA
jgi:MATE family multidrug resistance protein